MASSSVHAKGTHPACRLVDGRAQAGVRGLELSHHSLALALSQYVCWGGGGCGIGSRAGLGVNRLRRPERTTQSRDRAALNVDGPTTLRILTFYYRSPQTRPKVERMAQCFPTSPPPRCHHCPLRPRARSPDPPPVPTPGCGGVGTARTAPRPGCGPRRGGSRAGSGARAGRASGGGAGRGRGAGRGGGRPPGDSRRAGWALRSVSALQPRLSAPVRPPAARRSPPPRHAQLRRHLEDAEQREFRRTPQGAG